MKDKIMGILEDRLKRRSELEEIHGVGRISHNLQIPLHIDEAEWLIDRLIGQPEGVSNAKEYISERFKKDHNYTLPIPFYPKELAELMESYHLAKSKEEAEERYLDAWNTFQAEASSGITIEFAKYLHIASGKEKE
ncbi:MAG: hypothetical protein KAJ19_17835 [Gammaproteobacteria bacterium]|nr:hypothetical protein [Gammaproteobacteria bacterium]